MLDDPSLAAQLDALSVKHLETLNTHLSNADRLTIRDSMEFRELFPLIEDGCVAQISENKK